MDSAKNLRQEQAGASGQAYGKEEKLAQNKDWGVNKPGRATNPIQNNSIEINNAQKIIN